MLRLMQQRKYSKAGCEKKHVCFLIKRTKILPSLGMSTWELKKPAQSNSPDAMRCTRMYEHIRDSLLLHFQSVLLMFTFIPDLCKYLFCGISIAVVLKLDVLVLDAPPVQCSFLNFIRRSPQPWNSQQYGNCFVWRADSNSMGPVRYVN